MHAQSETRWSRPLPSRLPNSPLIRVLARAMLAGEPAVAAIQERCARTLGRNWRWLGPLARRYAKAFTGQTRPRLREVAAFLVADEGFAKARRRHRDTLRVVDWLGEPQQMRPVAAAAGWGIPQINSVAALAEWLGLGADELEWVADLRG